MKLDPQGQMRPHKRVDPYAALPVFAKRGGTLAVQRLLNVGPNSAEGIINTLEMEKLIERIPSNRFQYRLTEKGIEKMGGG